MKANDECSPDGSQLDAPPTLDYAPPADARPWWSAADAVLCGLVLCGLGLLLALPAVLSGAELVGGWHTDFPWASGFFVLALPAAGLGVICFRAGVQAAISGVRASSAAHRRTTESTDSDAKQV